MKRHATVLLVPVAVGALVVGITYAAANNGAGDGSTTPSPAAESPARTGDGAGERRDEQPAPSQEPVQAPGPDEEVQTGNVVPEPSAADARTPLQPATDRTKDGAVAAFTSLATWFLASPAAREEPAQAVEEAGALLNAVDAQQLVQMVRSDRDAFAAEKGGYRVLGHDGNEDTPGQVMVEVVAPLTTKSGTRWVIVGGIVSWHDGQWHLASISPTELESQPRAASADAGAMSVEDQSQVFPGLGWQLFADQQG